MIWGVVVGAAVVLAVAGVAKLAKPMVTVEAARTVVPAVGEAAITVLGLAELILGVVVVTWRWPVAAALLGLCYVGFAGFSVALFARRERGASCGCFGRPDARIGVEHVVVNTLVGVTALAAALGFGSTAVDPIAVVGSVALLFALLAVVPTVRSTGA